MQPKTLLQFSILNKRKRLAIIMSGSDVELPDSKLRFDEEPKIFLQTILNKIIVCVTFKHCKNDDEENKKNFECRQENCRI